MMDNIDSIQQLIINNVENYEDEKAGRIDPYERMLRYLEAPYERMPQHERVYELLKQQLTESDIEVWFAFPDYSYSRESLPLEEAVSKFSREIPGFAEGTQKLIDMELLVQVPRQDGRTGYMRSYMLYLAFGAVLRNDHKPLTDAFIDWWMHVLSDKTHLRALHPEHRVLPNQTSLTGTSGATGRIQMNLEIPDTREVLPSDLSDAVLGGVDCMAVIDCVCRAATEARGVRSCDYPIHDVCFLFNEAAREAIELGYGKELSNEEGIELMHQLRDMGLVQVISNAARPLSLCNCCSCCCICLNSIAKQEGTIAIPSRFQAEIDRGENCVGCGRCVSICQMSAITLSETGAGISAAACIGCGQCVVKCPAQVIRMKLKPGAPSGLARQTLDRIYL